MKCPICGTENQSGFKYCVKCGLDLEKSQDVNIEQIGQNGYYSEDEPQKGGYTIGNGTFIISDRVTPDSSSDLYTADELNSSSEEFDFSSFDEPFIPKLDADRITLPEQIRSPQHRQQDPPPAYGSNIQPIINDPASSAMPQMNNLSSNSIPQMNGMPSMNQHGGNMYNQPVGGYNQPMNAYPQPSVIGYDQNGMPIYGQPQPVMYSQPPVIGYDQNGMPIYGQPQPVMYGQPPVIGYDQNGMPIYGQPQPVMYGQLPIIGYDQNGMPVYGQPQQNVYQNKGAANNINQMQGIPTSPNHNNMMNDLPQPPPIPPPEEEKRVDVPDDFWEFFDGGKATKHNKESDNDFFGKHGGDMDDLSTASVDLGRLKKFERKRNDYMSDTPVVNGAQLSPNDDLKFNRLYMRQTDSVNAADLQYNEKKQTQDRMRVTREVNADSLVKNQKSMSWNVMGKADTADASMLESFVPERKSSIMAQADHAVEALPQKRATYNDEIDAIELPEYMKAKKTAKNDKMEIPGIPEL